MEFGSDSQQLKDRLPYKENGKYKYLNISDLQEGDVLLSSSELTGTGSWITRLVRVLDGEGYSHMAFFDGEKAIESGLKAGVNPIAIEKAVGRNRYTDVYRFISKDGKPIGHPDWPTEPLAVKAGFFVGREYGECDAILAGVLVVMRRKLSCTSRQAKVMIRALWEAIARLQAMLKSTPPREAITCAELIYRIFDEAEPVNKYRIDIELTREFSEDVLISSLNGAADGESVLEIGVAQALTPGFERNSASEDYPGDGASEEKAELLGLINQFSELYRDVKGRNPLGLPGNDHAYVVFPFDRDKLDRMADYVTPGDFCRSINLVPCGRIRKYPKEGS